MVWWVDLRVKQVPAIRRKRSGPMCVRAVRQAYRRSPTVRSHPIEVALPTVALGREYDVVTVWTPNRALIGAPRECQASHCTAGQFVDPQLPITGCGGH